MSSVPPPTEKPGTPGVPELPTVDAARTDPGRRRLFRGLTGGVGVLLSVQAKTALGQTALCQSPSATMSGNTSPRPGSGVTCSGGRSPGYWKQPQKFDSWTQAGASAPTFDEPVDDCASGVGDLLLSNILTQGTLAADIFPGAQTILNGTSYGLWAVLAFPNEFNGGMYLRHLAAAWLNAGLFISSGEMYPITRAQILEMWNATKSGGLYCPGSIGNCGTSGWSAAQVQSYIEGMYDLSASGADPVICKKKKK